MHYLMFKKIFLLSKTFVIMATQVCTSPVMYFLWFIKNLLPGKAFVILSVIIWFLSSCRVFRGKKIKDLANDCTGMLFTYVILRSLKNRNIPSSTSKCPYFFHLWKVYSAPIKNPYFLPIFCDIKMKRFLYWWKYWNKLIWDNTFVLSVMRNKCKIKTKKEKK